MDESYGMVMMPAVVKGTESGIKALALVTLDLESAGEHWGTIFLAPGGPLEQGNAELTEEQKRAIGEYYLPYDYWYTPVSNLFDEPRKAALTFKIRCNTLQSVDHRLFAFCEARCLNFRHIAGIASAGQERGLKLVVAAKPGFIC